MSASRFQLQTLGGLALVARDSGLPALVNQRKRLALLVILSADTNGGVPRERLFAFFWPESDSERARNALNQLTFAIRRELGDDAIVSDGTVLRANPEILDSDLREFRAAVAERRYGDAVALYRGPLLDGVFLRDAPEFERWAEDLRARVAGEYAQALEGEIATALSAKRFADAIRLAQLRAAAEPLSAHAALQLMQAFEQAGDITSALRHAAAHAALVRAELESDPDPRITAEVRRLRDLSAAGKRPAAQREVVSEPAVEIQPRPAPTAPPEIQPPPASTAPPAPLAPRPTPRRRYTAAVLWTCAAAAIATTIVLTAAARAHRDPGTVVITSAAARPDVPVEPALRARLLHATSELLARSRRNRVLVDTARASCIVHFLSPRCAPAFQVNERVLAMGDSISVLTTVTLRDGGERRDLPAIVRPQAQLSALISEAAQQAAGAVAALSDPLVPELRSAARLPRYDAYLEYARAADAVARDLDTPVRETLEAAAMRDTSFAAPRIALLERSDAGTRATLEEWIGRHRPLLSTRDQMLVVLIEAENFGDSDEWFRVASNTRDAYPRDAQVLRQFALAAYYATYYAAADSALSQLRAVSASRMLDRSMHTLQIDARHGMNDFDGAGRLWRELAELHPEDDDVCTTGILQFAAGGREGVVDSLIHHCALHPQFGDRARLGRRVSLEDELYRRAGREYVWHGHAREARRAFDTAYVLERQLYAHDSMSNNGWLAKELARDWSAAHSLMLDDFARAYPMSPPCKPVDRRRACMARNRLRFGVTAGHLGDTATALATIRWIDSRPHDDSSWHVDRAKVLLSLGKRLEAIRELRWARKGAAPGLVMDANTELLDLRGDPAFEALIAPRTR